MGSQQKASTNCTPLITHVKKAGGAANEVWDGVDSNHTNLDKMKWELWVVLNEEWWCWISSCCSSLLAL
ncbi:hypothetical protein ACE6H2_026535 [Prunus campanulata]